MTPPYRTRQGPRETGEPKAGLVADMVRQFADPYAFLRELVQNSMDAGSTAIEIGLTRALEGEVHTSVADDGSGMTPELIENALLTLFSSSKEGDPTKIGKYGVGFISVLAIGPELVVVETWRQEGAWRVRVSTDHQYVIEEAPKQERSGTVVTLGHHMDSERFEVHVRFAFDALRRWCRHATVPIHLSVTDYTNPQGSYRRRIDSPLSIHAAESVTEIEGEDTIVVGPSSGAGFLEPPEAATPIELGARFLGFYNRGLTLYETGSEVFDEFEGLRVKISSPRLKHTLSRDNVQRDRWLDELVSRARSLARKSLPSVLEKALSEQAREVASGAPPARYLALLHAAANRPLGLGWKHCWFPLTDPVDGEIALTAREIKSRTPWRELGPRDLVGPESWQAPVLTAAAGDALTRAVADSGRPVVLCPHPSVPTLLAALLDLQESSGCEPCAKRHVLVGDLEMSRADARLCLEIAKQLAHAGSPVAAVRLASALGAKPGRVVIALTPSPGLMTVEKCARAATRWGKAATLLLDPRETTVELARSHAKKQPIAAAQLLARVILLERRGPASAKANDALLAALEDPA